MIIDELEASLTGTSIDATNPKVLVATVEANYDKYVRAGTTVAKIKSLDMR